MRLIALHIGGNQGDKKNESSELSEVWGNPWAGVTNCEREISKSISISSFFPHVIPGHCYPASHNPSVSAEYYIQNLENFREAGGVRKVLYGNELLHLFCNCYLRGYIIGVLAV